jgi:hypothetical protein
VHLYFGRHSRLTDVPYEHFIPSGAQSVPANGSCSGHSGRGSGTARSAGPASPSEEPHPPAPLSSLCAAKSIATFPPQADHAIGTSTITNAASQVGGAGISDSSMPESSAPVGASGAMGAIRWWAAAAFAMVRREAVARRFWKQTRNAPWLLV